MNPAAASWTTSILSPMLELVSSKTITSSGHAQRFEEPDVLLDAVLVDVEVLLAEPGDVLCRRVRTVTLSATRADPLRKIGGGWTGRRTAARRGSGRSSRAVSAAAGSSHDRPIPPSAPRAIGVPTGSRNRRRIRARRPASRPSPERANAEADAYVIGPPSAAPKSSVARCDELVPGVGVALAAEVLEGVGRGDAAEPARTPRRSRPSASPFIKPPRNASPTPVGSTIWRGGTAGTSMRPCAV